MSFHKSFECELSELFKSCSTTKLLKFSSWILTCRTSHYFNLFALEKKLSQNSWMNPIWKIWHHENYFSRFVHFFFSLFLCDNEFCRALEIFHFHPRKLNLIPRASSPIQACLFSAARRANWLIGFLASFFSSCPLCCHCLFYPSLVGHFLICCSVGFVSIVVTLTTDSIFLGCRWKCYQSISIVYSWEFFLPNWIVIDS